MNINDIIVSRAIVARDTSSYKHKACNTRFSACQIYAPIAKANVGQRWTSKIIIAVDRKQ
jgi:hypothetical protein